MACEPSPSPIDVDTNAIVQQQSTARAQNLKQKSTTMLY